jgi:hypothetical protein
MGRVLVANAVGMMLSPQFKILWSIVRAVAILMMGMFLGPKISTEHLLHDQAMFAHIAVFVNVRMAVSAYMNISLGNETTTFPSSRSVKDVSIFSEARTAATSEAVKLQIVSNFAFPSRSSRSAIGANDRDTLNSLGIEFNPLSEVGAHLIYSQRLHGPNIA